MQEGPALAALAAVQVEVSAQVGSARVALGDVLSFAEGSVVALGCAPDAPATLLVNGVAVATGDIVLADDDALAFEIAAVIA